MDSRRNVVSGVAVCILILAASMAIAADWPQWRGANRDAKASGFKAPASWPAELTKKWQITIGDGVATPALVDDRLYVFTREDGQEVTRCLNAATGEEIWRVEYASEGTTGGASGFQGPRASPTVVDGKVVTLGVRGVLSCLDAATGKVNWRKDDFGAWPMFYTSSSPIVVDGLCIAQLGGRENGGIVAYDLVTGDERWKWTDEGPSYASPVLMTVGGEHLIVTPTESSLVGVSAAGGKLRWKIQYSQGRYNSATPIVDGQTIIMAGPGSGMSAVSVAKNGEELSEELLWNNTDNSVQFNSPVLKDGYVFGLSNNSTLFCINAASHETAWSAPLGGASEQPGGGPPVAGRGFGGPFGGDREGRPRGERGQREESRAEQPEPGQSPPRNGDVEQASAEQPAEGQDADRSQAGERRGRGEGARGGDGERRGRGRFGRGGRGRGGYGSIVDAGSVLMVLTPASELVVFEPSTTEFKELARYKVSETPTYAYPVPTENGIYVKDQETLALWTAE